MSIVVFNPDSVEDVDFAERMRHPATADAAVGMWLSDTEPSYVDVHALRQGRLARLRRWMAEAGYGAVVLFDPYNQRYATGSRNMFGYFLRNSTRYFFVPAAGPIVLFEYPQSYHVSHGARHGRRGAAVQAGLVVGVEPRRREPPAPSPTRSPSCCRPMAAAR